MTPRAAHRLAVASLLSVLGACTTYAPLPLPQGNDLADHIVRQPFPALDMDSVATLAVLHNPDLRAARAALHVSQAQAFAAGLLPDPQFTYSAEHPTDHVVSYTDPRYPEYNAYGLGLAVDLQTLLTHSNMHASATAAYQQEQLNLLWQEWQTVSQARTLYVQQAIASERQQFLAPAAQIYEETATASQRALAAGNVTLERSSADQAVMVDIRSQLGVAERSALQAQQELRTLLGVQPQVVVPLQPLKFPPIPDRAAVIAALARLPQSRPDLRALQAGYRSQEHLLHAAVLSQFPDLSLGISKARDPSDTHTIGASVSLTLTLFDRGRGRIGVQKATREQLHAEYQARLDQTTGDVWQLWNELQQLNAQLGDIEERLPTLQSTTESARSAYLRGEFASASYLTLASAYLAARTTHFDLMQNLWTDSIALATLLGTQVAISANANE